MNPTNADDWIASNNPASSYDWIASNEQIGSSGLWRYQKHCRWTFCTFLCSRVEIVRLHIFLRNKTTGTTFTARYCFAVTFFVSKLQIAHIALVLRSILLWIIQCLITTLLLNPLQSIVRNTIFFPDKDTHFSLNGTIVDQNLGF